MTSDKWKRFVNIKTKELKLDENISKLLLSCDFFKNKLNIDQIKLRRGQEHPELPKIKTELTPLTNYLPIEYLKTRSHSFFSNKDPYKTFLSSGTTGAKRSQSHYSKDGLERYKLQSLSTFFAVLNCFFGKRIWDSHVISLIPSTKEWDTSSLAQMVEWIGEFLPITYVTPEKLREETDNCDERPIVIFGTAFHFVNLMDNDKSNLSLNQQSLLIETGGTKGRSREVSKEEFYHELCQYFSISTDQIISEYGMCELATQAYEFSLPNRKRSFQFPPWVQVFIAQGLHEFQTTGTGALSLYDPLRTDYPWMIRVQDQIQLAKDQSFQLDGRIKGTLLKGCSLLAEDIKGNQNGVVRKRKGIQTAETRFPKSWIHFSDHLCKLFDSFDFRQSLEEELHYKFVVEDLVQDLKSSIPQSSKGWIDALKSCDPHSSLKSWLYILPNNHSIAGIYPLVLGTLLGQDIAVRIPKAFASDSSPLSQAINFLESELHCQIKKLPHHYRVDANTELSFDAMIVYGEDHTINSLQTTTKLPIAGFGSLLSIALLDKVEIHDTEALLKDVTHLSQLGCLSTRMICLKSKDIEFLKSLRDQILITWSSINKKTLPLHTILAHDTEEKRYAELHAHLHQRKSSWPLLPILTDAKEATSLLSEAPFVIPIIGVDKKSQIEKSLNTNIQWIGSEEAVKLGEGSKVLWDGFYQGKPLFAVKT